MLAECNFETARLVMRPWHAFHAFEWNERPLHEVVMALMTAAVTRWLPEDWRGEYSKQRAESWVSERDVEGTVLLVVEKSSRNAVGLLILGDDEMSEGASAYLGYLLAELVWGKGLATELVTGFTVWCSDQSEIRSVLAGADAGNTASITVLEKAGFHRVADEGDTASEIQYRLLL